MYAILNYNVYIANSASHQQKQTYLRLNLFSWRPTTKSDQPDSNNPRHTFFSIGRRKILNEMYRTWSELEFRVRPTRTKNSRFVRSILKKDSARARIKLLVIILIPCNYIIKKSLWRFVWKKVLLNKKRKKKKRFQFSLIHIY